VWINVRPIGAEGLKRNDAAGADIGAVEQRLEGFQYGSICGLRQQAQQWAFALEQAAQDAGDGKGPVTVRNWGEDISGKFFGEEDGALGLTAGAEIPGAAGISQKMLLPAFWAANSSEAALKPATGQELLNGAHDRRTQGSGTGLEALFVSPDITVKVSLKQLVENGPFWMSWPVWGGGFRNNPAIRILIRTKACLGCMRTKDNRLKPEGHGGQ